VIDIAGEDLLALSSVHGPSIDRDELPL
jgi:hypothetical protein